MSEPASQPKVTDAFRAANQCFVDKWKVLGPVKARLRNERIRNADTQKAVAALAGMRHHAITRCPAPDRSGFEEMHRYFRKLPTAGPRRGTDG